MGETVPFYREIASLIEPTLAEYRGTRRQRTCAESELRAHERVQRQAGPGAHLPGLGAARGNG